MESSVIEVGFFMVSVNYDDFLCTDTNHTHASVTLQSLFFVLFVSTQIFMYVICHMCDHHANFSSMGLAQVFPNSHDEMS